MTKLPKIEPCVCGRLPACLSPKVFCNRAFCWIGPTRKSVRAAIIAWNAVMKAAKAAKKARVKK